MGHYTIFLTEAHWASVRRHLAAASPGDAAKRALTCIREAGQQYGGYSLDLYPLLARGERAEERGQAYDLLCTLVEEQQRLEASL